MPYPAKTNRDDIVREALELLETKGPAALSMRTLASKLGVNASSLYHHFSNKEVLEKALADEGARVLLERLETATRRQAAEEAFQTTARAYLDFCHGHPALYDLFTAPRPPTQAEAGAGKDLWNFVLARVAEVTGRPDDTAAAVAFWSFLHGFVSLERAGLFGLSGAREGLEAGLEALLSGLPKVERTGVESK